MQLKPTNPQFEGLQVQYTADDDVSLQCIVKPGLPEVLAIDFSCETHNDSQNTTVNGTQASQLSFRVTVADNNTHCTCHGSNGLLSSNTEVIVIYVDSKGGSSTLSGWQTIVVSVCGVMTALIGVWGTYVTVRGKKNGTGG